MSDVKQKALEAHMAIGCVHPLTCHGEALFTAGHAEGTADLLPALKRAVEALRFYSANETIVMERREGIFLGPPRVIDHGETADSALVSLSPVLEKYKLEGGA